MTPETIVETTTAPRSVSPVSSPAAWTGAELARSDDWIHRLTAGEIAAARDVAARVRDLGRPLASLGADDVPLGALAPAVKRWRDTLHRGRGFALIRGLP